MTSIQYQHAGMVPCPVALTGGLPTYSIFDGDPICMYGNAVIPANAYPWTTDLATTQAAFAAVFRGISFSRSRASTTDTNDLQVMVNDDGEGQFLGRLAVAALLHVGDYVGPAKASGNALLNTLVKVSDISQAIGIVTREIGSSVNYCYMKLVNTLNLRKPGSGGGGSTSVITDGSITSRTFSSRFANVYNALDYGAFGDNASHVLDASGAAIINSFFSAYGSIGAVAGDENDWAVLQGLLYKWGTTGIPIYLPVGRYWTNKPLVEPYVSNPLFDQVNATRGDCIFGDGLQSQIHGLIATSGRAILELLGSSNGESVCASIRDIRLYARVGSHLGSACLRIGDANCGIDMHRVYCHGVNGLLLKLADSSSYSMTNARFSQCQFWSNYGSLHWPDPTTCIAYSVKPESGGAFWDNVQFDTCLFWGTLQSRASICVVQNCQFVSDPRRPAAVGVPYSANVFVSAGKFESRSSYYEDHKYGIYLIDGEAPIRGVLITGGHFSGTNNALGAGRPTAAIYAANTGNFGFGLLTLINNDFYSAGYLEAAIQARYCHVFELGSHDLFSPNSDVTFDYTGAQYSRVDIDGKLHTAEFIVAKAGASAISLPLGGVTAQDALTSATSCNAPFMNSTRVGGGSVAGAIWGLGISNPQATNGSLFGWSSTNYTSAPALNWLGNDQPFAVLPLGKTWKFGFGANALDYIELGLGTLYAPQADASFKTITTGPLTISKAGADYLVITHFVINPSGASAFNWQLSGSGHCDLYMYDGAAWQHNHRITYAGDIVIPVVGGGLSLKEGTDAKMGVVTLVAGVAVVPTVKVTANSRIFLTLQSLGTVSVPSGYGVTARTAGTSFTISASVITDTSIIAWMIVEPN